MARKRKMNGSLLRRIISIVDSIFKLFKLLGHLEKKAILFGLPIIVVCVSVSIVFIVNSDISRDPPTPPPTSDVNPKVQLKKSNELDSEKPKDIQKSAESGTQRTEIRSLSKEINDIKAMREDVKSGTQHMEDMRESVKAMTEDVKKMTEDAKKMKEKLDGGSED